MMAGSELSRRESPARRELPSPQAEATQLFEEMLRSARAEIEEYVATWTGDLVLARLAVHRDIRTGNENRFSESAALLKCLEEALHRAPDRMEKHLLGRLQEAREKAQHSAHDVPRRFESVFSNAPIGMALVDRVGRWLEVNAAFCSTTGYSWGELKATTLEAITHPDDVDLDRRQKRDLLDGRIPSYEVEVRYRHARGHHLWVLVTASLVRDDLGEPLYAILQVQDISERKELAERLAYQVDHDFLTGLSNRRRFEQELAREARRASRYGSGGALLLIDLDHFKDVNDALGHKAGDHLLKGVAGALRRRMRQTDVLARVGGDEFAVLLPQTGAEEARIVAAGIVDTLRQRVAVVSEPSIRVTASVGVALFDGLRSEELLAHAYLAMCDAKAAGRGRFAMYQAESHSGVERVRKTLEREPQETLCRRWS